MDGVKMQKERRKKTEGKIEKKSLSKQKKYWKINQKQKSKQNITRKSINKERESTECKVKEKKKTEV